MIVPDVNLLVHAYNSDSPVHDRARRWWEGLVNGSRQVGLTWVVILGFIRISTHRQILSNPLPVRAAILRVRTWLEQPSVTLLEPGTRHVDILFDLLEGLGTAGNLTTDAHLAALAIEHQAELHSSDADFARFSGLRWHNPLVKHAGSTSAAAAARAGGARRSGRARGRRQSGAPRGIRRTSGGG